MKNIDEISIGAASFNTLNHDRSMTTINIDRDLSNNRTNVPGSRLSNRSKLSNPSRSAKDEGFCVNNILLDDYGMVEVKTKKLKTKHRTTDKKHAHSKKRSQAILPVKDLMKNFYAPNDKTDATSLNDS